eukprot:CAMPEP_0175050086 /NCGR_PEP_ID=MMETSP0052_2-20121109/7076_1 /TAXON_ID=51329 ORGANISM="Polytomella parva, Strain SAG 63-3" /NCGR_SAMPLE_ID=MMETSP0052_2 /ASSEMBLY_ACC=CAM_ASM_000194 /LENGTH=85 /DNA_ID=CAMNT_0016314275 /DNA_START=593 /DNA_END=851 /DNA_ORIENTATION=-
MTMTITVAMITVALVITMTTIATKASVVEALEPGVEEEEVDGVDEVGFTAAFAAVMRGVVVRTEDVEEGALVEDLRLDREWLAEE